MADSNGGCWRGLSTIDNAGKEAGRKFGTHQVPIGFFAGRLDQRGSFAGVLCISSGFAIPAKTRNPESLTSDQYTLMSFQKKNKRRRKNDLRWVRHKGKKAQRQKGKRHRGKRHRGRRQKAKGKKEIRKTDHHLRAFAPLCLCPSVPLPLFDSNRKNLSSTSSAVESADCGNRPHLPHSAAESSRPRERRCSIR